MSGAQESNVICTSSTLRQNLIKHVGATFLWSLTTVLLGSCEEHIHLDVFRFAGIGVLKWHCLCRCLLSYLHAIEAVARSSHPQHDWCALAFVSRSFDCGIIGFELAPSSFTFLCQGVVGDSRLGEAGHFTWSHVQTAHIQSSRRAQAT
jgi:hypothetical protein